ncbi:MAG: hypothetical protein HYZ23_07920 [Chloroflexi bacterium]|nr:hypothetical protein [Chloroflexota bacterium]
MNLASLGALDLLRQQFAEDVIPSVVVGERKTDTITDSLFQSVPSEIGES